LTDTNTDKSDSITDTKNAEGNLSSRPVDLADNIERKLHPNFIPVQKLVGWIVFGIFAFIAATGTCVILLLADMETWFRIGLSNVALILVIMLCWFAHYWPAIDYRYRSYRLNTHCIEIKKGILWRKVLNVPRTRLQHIDVNSGPIERKYGLAHLIIHTAGTVGASVMLEGLDQETAVQIRDYLVATRSDDAV